MEPSYYCYRLPPHCLHIFLMASSHLRDRIKASKDKQAGGQNNEMQKMYDTTEERYKGT